MVELRRNSPLAKKFGKKTSEIEVPEGLSEVEREQFLKANGISNSEKPKTEDKKDQTISKVKHDEEIGELKEKLRKKEEKIGDLNKDRDDLRKERDTYKSRWERARSDFEEEQKKSNDYKEQLRKANDDIDAKKKEIKRLTEQPINVQVPEDTSETKKALKKAKKDNAELSGKIEELKAEITRLTADNSSKDSTIEHLNSTIKEFDTERARFEDTITLKDEEIEGLKNRMELSSEHLDVATSGLLIRQNVDEIASDLLDDGNYEIKLARNGSYMLIIPDVEGSAVCKNHRIILPRLGELVPFSIKTEYPLNPVGNNIFRVELK